MCAANAVITKDPTGARKLDKSRATGRIDGLQAMVMAFGIAAHANDLPASSGEVFFV
jgi:phage terminase large subunit-like protein